MTACLLQKLSHQRGPRSSHVQSPWAQGGLPGTLCKACRSVHGFPLVHCDPGERGLFASEPRPGLGIKEWGRLAVQQYTLAPTGRIQDPVTGGGEQGWSDEAGMAYKDFCYEIFERTAWTYMDEAATSLRSSGSNPSMPLRRRIYAVFSKRRFKNSTTAIPAYPGTKIRPASAWS